jgi:hypothetical protein
VYKLLLRADGTFEAHYGLVYNGLPAKDDMLHPGGYNPHELLTGSWEMTGSTLVLLAGHERYEAQVRHSIHHSIDGWDITWDNLTYFSWPNHSTEPTAASGTSAAEHPPRQP